MLPVSSTFPHDLQDLSLILIVLPWSQPTGVTTVTAVATCL